MTQTPKTKRTSKTKMPITKMPKTKRDGVVATLVDNKFMGLLIGWTLFLWVSRLRNVLNNDELTSGGQAVRIGVVVIFVVLAAVAFFALRRNQPKLLVVFLSWTVGYWLIRGIGILIDGDYSVGFKAIHTVLMVVSLTLSALAARQLSPQR